MILKTLKLFKAVCIPLIKMYQTKVQQCLRTILLYKLTALCTGGLRVFQ